MSKVTFKANDGLWKAILLNNIGPYGHEYIFANKNVCWENKMNVTDAIPRCE